MNARLRPEAIRDFCKAIFDEHYNDLRTKSTDRRNLLALHSVASSGKRAHSDQPASDIGGIGGVGGVYKLRTQDQYVGCARLRVLRHLLSEIDDKGYVASRTQIRDLGCPALLPPLLYDRTTFLLPPDLRGAITKSVSTMRSSAPVLA